MADKKIKRPLPIFKHSILRIWYNIFLRNFIIVSIPTILFIISSIVNVGTDFQFQERLSKSFDYVNIASGIIASFVLGFLINKVITIRQDKINRTKEIKKLSNQLTYFRNICYRILRDHTYWEKGNPSYKSYQYGNSIKNDITYEEYQFPNYDDDIAYAKYNSFYNENVSHSVVSLVLQLHMMADDSFVGSGLSFTKFPSNYIYTLTEMQRFIMFSDSNKIWYCSSELFSHHLRLRKSWTTLSVFIQVKNLD